MWRMKQTLFITGTGKTLLTALPALHR